MSRTDNVAYVSLGSNLGNRVVLMRAAVHAMAEHPQVHWNGDANVASLYETTPVGGPAGQGAYLNSAMRVVTTREPRELFKVLLRIESALGRIRSQRWGPRVIDLDLLLFDGVVGSWPGLVLPHPRLHERRFVLEPLSEIAGDVVHPVLGVSIRALAERCRRENGQDRVERAAGRQWALAGAKMPTGASLNRYNARARR